MKILPDLTLRFESKEEAHRYVCAARDIILRGQPNPRHPSAGSTPEHWELMMEVARELGDPNKTLLFASIVVPQRVLLAGIELSGMFQETS